MAPLVVAYAMDITREFTIDAARTIDFMGEDARVYATPMLVRDIEVTCRELEIDHLAPTLLGMKVKISARLVERKGRSVLFEVTANDNLETICRGRHARFVVDIARTKKRLQEKKARAM